ncbi:hypothetical protein LOK49_LG01G01041 [Camellia lanceoleosa]|uniref:Uncharacterized protein n=1 Tax=Camellia lanceoleosa TaxID=1840588 RepID=A0ACC0J639_9ERIC|nr:hypothetical protein LOK49_LG01G01041 [Camellia lanceoleosa]
MANYHFVYKDVEGVSTQWDDIQRKLGNLPLKPPAFKPPSFTPTDDEDSKHKDKAGINDRTEEQLQDLEDDSISMTIASFKSTCIIFRLLILLIMRLVS